MNCFTPMIRLETTITPDRMISVPDEYPVDVPAASAPQTGSLSMLQ